MSSRKLTLHLLFSAAATYRTTVSGHTDFGFSTSARRELRRLVFWYNWRVFNLRASESLYISLNQESINTFLHSTTNDLYFTRGRHRYGLDKQ
jgi:hypothetical protein